MSDPLVINEREDEFAHIALWYHGAHARPKLTLRVEFVGPGQSAIETPVPEDKAMDAFNHPFAYLGNATALGSGSRRSYPS